MRRRLRIIMRRRLRICQVLIFLDFRFRTGHKLGQTMPKKNLHAVELGKLGGAKGGKSRAARLTPAERSAGARKAALAR